MSEVAGGGGGGKKSIITIYSANTVGIAVKRMPLAHTKRGSQKGGSRGRGGGGGIKDSIITNYLANIDGRAVKRKPLANRKEVLSKPFWGIGTPGWGVPRRDATLSPRSHTAAATPESPRS